MKIKNSRSQKKINDPLTTLPSYLAMQFGLIKPIYIHKSFSLHIHVFMLPSHAGPKSYSLSQMISLVSFQDLFLKSFSPGDGPS